MERALTFHTDPGHAWLEVPKAELVGLGIDKDISPFSYMKGPTAYLEEDCDAGLFIDKLMEAGTSFKFYEIHKENTPIRNYASYSAGGR